MSISVERFDASVVDVAVSDSTLRVVLADGRELSAPIACFPRLRDGTPRDRLNWRPIGRGQGIHWPALDEDISIGSLLRMA